MDTDRACELIRQRMQELEGLQPSTETPEFSEWSAKTRRTLDRVFGTEHATTNDFLAIQWVAVYDEYNESVFSSARDRAFGLFRAAVYELEELSLEAGAAELGGLDPELFEHVRHDIEREEWGKVVRETCVFTEDRIRTWAGRPNTEVGERLMTTVFGDEGVFKLGIENSEQQGWHRLAMGLAMAVRNPATHRIPERDDIPRYALGVLGTASLLLTQLRHQHGNSFRSG